MSAAEPNTRNEILRLWAVVAWWGLTFIPQILVIQDMASSHSEYRGLAIPAIVLLTGVPLLLGLPVAVAMLWRTRRLTQTMEGTMIFRVHRWSKVLVAGGCLLMVLILMVAFQLA